MVLPSAGTPTGRLPNLVVVGVSKAGTTSLFNYLRQHPEVCPSDVKELRYFSPLRYGEALGPLDAYAAHFSGCNGQRFALEATPGYFYGGRALARGLRDTCPDVRCLLSLRRPDDRCWSWFQFVKSRTRIPKEMTFDAYLDRCEDLHRAGTDGDIEHQAFWGLGGGCYASWLDAWMEELGDRLRILFFDAIVSDPRWCVDGIFDWLGIDSGVAEHLQFAVDNKTEQYHHRRLQKAAVKINRGGERFFHRHQSIKRIVRTGYYAVNRAPSEESMTPAQQARLANFYRPHNERLSNQLSAAGLTLPPSWSRLPAGPPR